MFWLAVKKKMAEDIQVDGGPTLMPIPCSNELDAIVTSKNSTKFILKDFWA